MNELINIETQIRSLTVAVKYLTVLVEVLLVFAIRTALIQKNEERCSHLPRPETLYKSLLWLMLLIPSVWIFLAFGESLVRVIFGH